MIFFHVLFRFFLDVLFLLLASLPMFAGVCLIWKHSGIRRILGWVLLLVLSFYWFFYSFSWTSSWYAVRGGERVQDFSLKELGAGPFVSWMDTPPRLLLEPDPSYVLPEGERVLSVDLEARQARWLPKAAVNLDDVIMIRYLNKGSHNSFDERGALSVNYASPSKVGTRAEFSFIGFSLPRLVYRIPWFFSEASGWKWEKNYFGWVRLVVRESEPGPVVVELNQILFNSHSALFPSLYPLTTWLLRGRFLVIEPETYIDPRVLVLGPFNTSQNTHSTNYNSKE